MRIAALAELTLLLANLVTIHLPAVGSLLVLRRLTGARTSDSYLSSSGLPSKSSTATT